MFAWACFSAAAVLLGTLFDLAGALHRFVAVKAWVSPQPHKSLNTCVWIAVIARILCSSLELRVRLLALRASAVLAARDAVPWQEFGGSVMLAVEAGCCIWTGVLGLLVGQVSGPRLLWAATPAAICSTVVFTHGLIWRACQRSHKSNRFHLLACMLAWPPPWISLFGLLALFDDPVALRAFFYL